MRFIRSAHARVPANARGDYVALLRAMEAVCRASKYVRGFYVMENVEQPNEFWEFYEFADEAASAAFATEEEGKRIVARIRALVPDELTETSFWQQRI